MMNQYEVPAYLEDALPEMREALVKKEVSSNIFDPSKSVQCLADFAIKNAREHNMKMLKRCFKSAERIYTHGNSLVKNAIENVFIYSFSMLFNTCKSKAERLEIQSLMPVHLYSAYVQQIIASKY